MEDEHDVVEAMRTDAAEERTALLAVKRIGEDSEVEGEEDEENEEEDDESTGRGRSAPPYYLNTVNSRLTSASGEGSTRRRSLVPV